METANVILGNNIDQNIRSSVRYILAQKMMEENFNKWLSQQNTINLIYKLLEECKKPNISLSTPSPIFVTKPNPLIQSGQYSFMPPVSPNSASLTNYQNEKRNLLTESQIKKKASEFNNVSIVQETTDKLPQFYFGRDFVSKDTIVVDEKFINQIFAKDELTIEEFLPITTELLEFPKLFNYLLFEKIVRQGDKISKKVFLKLHKDNFQGKDEYRRFFNLFATNGFIQRNDFLPFIKILLQYHPGLEFLKAHPEFQERYCETVIWRIFYTNDLNDDGKISYREFRKSNLIQIFRAVCEEPDINKIRDYFAYEHFYVMYCLFWDLDGNEHDFLIDKEEFSKYDGHSLSRKAVDRIFSQIPRKFKSGQSDKMNFEDFTWYLLSEEDKTTRTSIEYWFKVVDLDSNGIITFDNIQPSTEHKFTLNDFLKNKQYASVFFNNLLNLNKFLAHEQKDPFSRTEIDKNPEYSDWDKFAFYEYHKLTAEDSEEHQEANDSGIFGHGDSTMDDIITSNNSGND